MTKIQIEPESVDGLSASITAAAADIEGKLSTLGSASSTLQGQWSGEAMQAFAAMHRSWAADMADIAAVAHASAKAATKAATAFREADDRVGALWTL